MEVSVDPEYAPVTNLIMTCAKEQFEKDIATNSYHFTNNDGLATKLVIGLGAAKAGTEFWFFASQSLGNKTLKLMDTRYRWKDRFDTDNPDVLPAEELNYWNWCVFTNIISNFGLLSTSFNLINTLFLPQNVKDFIAQMPMDCSFNGYAQNGWGSRTQSFVPEIGSKGNIIYDEKSAEYISNPGGLYSIGLYSGYINNLPLNQKYFPSGVVKYWIVLRNPVDRAYSNLFWSCQQCNFTLMSKYVDNTVHRLQTSHPYFAPMLKSIDKAMRIDETPSSETKEKMIKKRVSDGIVKNFINGIYYDMLHESLNQYFDPTVRKFQALNPSEQKEYIKHISDYEYIELQFKRSLKFGRPLQRSCYYPQIRMLYDFYYANSRVKKARRRVMNVPMRLIQIDNMSNEYQSRLMEEYMCWVDDQCDLKLDMSKVTVNQKLHGNEFTNYKPQPITTEMRQKLEVFYRGCNEMLKTFLQDEKVEKELLFDGFPFVPWE